MKTQVAIDEAIEEMQYLIGQGRTAYSTAYNSAVRECIRIVEQIKQHGIEQESQEAFLSEFDKAMCHILKSHSVSIPRQEAVAWIDLDDLSNDYIVGFNAVKANHQEYMKKYKTAVYLNPPPAPSQKGAGEPCESNLLVIRNSQGDIVATLPRQKIPPPGIQQLIDKFENMHSQGDVWITTIAASKLVRAIDAMSFLEFAEHIAKIEREQAH